MQGQMSVPTDEHKRMSKLAGTWIGDDTLMPSPWLPKGGKAIGRMTARMALGGFHLIMDWTQERDGKVNFEGHGVLSWDPRGKCYTMAWFDCQGIEHGDKCFGPWEADTLVLTHEAKHLGHSRQVYVIGDGVYRFKLESSQDGKKWDTFMEGVYKRQ